MREYNLIILIFKLMILLNFAGRCFFLISRELIPRIDDFFKFCVLMIFYILQELNFAGRWFFFNFMVFGKNCENSEIFFLQNFLPLRYIQPASLQFLSFIHNRLLLYYKLHPPWFVDLIYTLWFYFFHSMLSNVTWRDHYSIKIYKSQLSLL